MNPESKIISVRKGSYEQYGSSRIAAALDWVMADSEQKGIFPVVNVSSNGQIWKTAENLGEFVKRLSARALFVQSAGNDNVNACNSSWSVPLINDGILIVGGVDENGAQAINYDNSHYIPGMVASGSNWGTCVEVWAPSQRIWSTWYTSTTGRELLSGTSMAAPHVSALASRFGSDWATTPYQREYYIRSKLVPTGYYDSYGQSINIPNYGYNGSTVPNLLTAASIYASSTLAGSSTAYVIDKLYNTSLKVWNSGGPAPAWIEFDLGTTRSLKGMRLTPEQWPASGGMTHNVYVGNTSPPTTLVETITGTLFNYQNSVSSRQPIVRNFEASGRYVRVETVASSSWVAWREIEIYGF